MKSGGKRQKMLAWCFSGKDILGLTVGSGRRRRDSVGAVGFPVGIGVNGFGLAGELGRKVSAVIDHSDYNSVCININQTNFQKNWSNIVSWKYNSALRIL